MTTKPTSNAPRRRPPAGLAAPAGRPSRPPREHEAESERFVAHVPGVDYGPLDRLVGYAVRRAQLAIYEDFMRALEPWGITPQRYSALTIVARNPGLKLTELGRIIGIARSGAGTVVAALEALGYVERLDSSDDKRAFALKLTRRGALALAKIDEAVAAHDARIAARLDGPDKARLLALLGALGAGEPHDGAVAAAGRDTGRP